MKLTDRMQGVADLVTPGLVVADIGTDHSYLPIYLVEKGIAPQAIAMDVNKGPLKKAQENIEKEGLSDRITTRLSDGLAKLQPGEARSVIIAGMGGRLVLKILSEAVKQWSDIREFILQPQSELEFFRFQMESWGFLCQQENMVFEDGKYYPMGRYIWSGKPEVNAGEIITEEDLSRVQLSAQERIFYRYGEGLLRGKHPVLKEYLQKEAKHFEALNAEVSRSADNEKKTKRLEEIRQKMQDNNSAMDFLK